MSQNIIPRSIKKRDISSLNIVWNDGHESLYTLELLRDNCPCASCSGETVLLHSYVPPEADKTSPGRYELRGIEQVGSYAIQFEWGDGHATGIYSWEYLLSQCPCPAHAGKGSL